MWCLGAFSVLNELLKTFLELFIRYTQYLTSVLLLLDTILGEIFG